MKLYFEWDEAKNTVNEKKHGVSFFEAQQAFLDPHRVIAEDIQHSTDAEKRYYCFGRVKDYVMTVRFVYRRGVVRIFGAGYWRRGKKIYDKAQN